MIVFDNHLLAAIPEVEVSVISCNTTLIKDEKIFCVSQHIRQRPLMQEWCNSCIMIPGDFYIMIGIFCHRSSCVIKPSIYYFIPKMVTLRKLLCQPNKMFHAQEWQSGLRDIDLCFPQVSVLH